MKFTRDGWVWTVGFIASIVTGLVTQFGLLQAAFPDVSPSFESKLKLAAFIIGIITGKLGFSPLPASPTAVSKDYTSSSTR